MKGERTRYISASGQCFRCIYQETYAISQGKNALVEQVASRDPCDGALRMTLLGALVRAYFYLAEEDEAPPIDLLMRDT